MKLPFKHDDPIIIPENHSLNLKRLKSLKNRLDKNKDLLQINDNVLQEQLKLGISEKIVTPIEAGRATYIPHREVAREDLASTTLRIIFLLW